MRNLGGLVIVLLGDRAVEDVPQALLDRLPQARWVRAERKSTFALLDLGGAPLLLGVVPEGRVRWQRAGVPARAEIWVDAIHDWSRRTRPALRGRPQ